MNKFSVTFTSIDHFYRVINYLNQVFGHDWKIRGKILRILRRGEHPTRTVSVGVDVDVKPYELTCKLLQ